MRIKILLKAPTLSRSGYGEHARFVLRALKQREDIFDIFLINLNWGQTSWFFEDNEERRWIDFLTKKTQHHVSNGGTFDISAQVTIPNEWERIAPVNVGITAGIETTHVSPVWVQKTEEVIDKIIVTSAHAKNGFDNTVCTARDQDGNIVNDNFRCTKPIEIVNYPAKVLDIKPVELTLPYDFNFLTMAQWGPRKNLENTIKWFVEEFHDDEVGLVLKINLANCSTSDNTMCVSLLHNALAPFPDRKCKIYLLHGDLSVEQMNYLYAHPKIKSYLTLTHGEGFGLPMFEAAREALPILTLEWSGQVDFLQYDNKNYFQKVNHTMETVQPAARWDGVIEADSQWAFADQGSYKMGLRKIFKDWAAAKKTAVELQGLLSSNFSTEELYSGFCQHFYNEEEENLEMWLDNFQVKEYE